MLITSTRVVCALIFISVALSSRTVGKRFTGKVVSENSQRGRRVTDALASSFTYEPCVNESTVAYHSSGKASFQKTFATCLENAHDPLLFEGYATNSHITVQAQVALNNLVEVNEVQNTVSVDFLLRVYWTDTRLNMPALWDALGPEVSASGVDLYQYIQAGNPGFWLPDFVFSEASSFDVTNEFIKLYPGGFVYWNRHIQMTLFATTLQYERYPEDSQAAIIRFFSYTIGDNLLTIEPRNADEGIVLFPNYDNSPSIVHNSVWDFLGAYATNPIMDFGTPGVPITRSVFVVHLNVSRRADGIILKLALPMLFLAIMGAMSFWTGLEERIATTMTVLLAVSALYIVVFANIPMLGYLTKFDRFVVEITLILFLITAVHHMVIRLQREEVLAKHPLRKFYLRLFDFCGRVFLIPIMLIVYLTLFTAFARAVLALFIVVVGICAAIGLRETASVRTTFVEAVNVLHARSLDPLLADTLARSERYALQFAVMWGFHFSPVDLSANKGIELEHTYADKGEFGLSSSNPYFTKEKRDQPARIKESAVGQRDAPAPPPQQASPTALPRQRSNLSHMAVVAAANAAAADAVERSTSRARAASPRSRPSPLSAAHSAPMVTSMMAGLDASPLRGGKTGPAQAAGSAPTGAALGTGTGTGPGAGYMQTPSWQLDAATGAALPNSKRRNRG